MCRVREHSFFSKLNETLTYIKLQISLYINIYSHRLSYIYSYTKGPRIMSFPNNFGEML